MAKPEQSSPERSEEELRAIADLRAIGRSLAAEAEVMPDGRMGVPLLSGGFLELVRSAPPISGESEDFIKALVERVFLKRGTKTRADEAHKAAVLLGVPICRELCDRALRTCDEQGWLTGDADQMARAVEVVSLTDSITAALDLLPDKVAGIKAAHEALASLVAAAGMALQAAKGGRDVVFRTAIHAGWRVLGNADEQIRAALATSGAGADGGGRHKSKPARKLEADLASGTASLSDSDAKLAAEYGTGERNVGYIKQAHRKRAKGG